MVYGHFGPKTVRHYIFGTEMSYFFVSVPKCLWEGPSLGHFGTSAELSQHFMKGPKYQTDTSAVPNCLWSEVSWVRSVRTPYQVYCVF